MLVRVERHQRGPRVYVGGRRAHEWHAGIALLAGVLTAWTAGEWRPSGAFWGFLAAGSYLVLKDWRDLVPSLRDTAVWDVGLHRRVAPLRAIRRADGLPSLAAVAAFAVGAVNLASALTPNVGWRGHLLLQALPARAVPLFHTLAVPASVALLAGSRSLRLRRRRALHAAVALLVALGVLDLLKGLDVEEALLSWAAAALLWWSREAFYVRHDRLRPGRALRAFAAVAAVAAAAGGLCVWEATGRSAGPLAVARQTLDLFAWTRGSVVYRDELALLPLALGLCTLAAILAASYLLFRPVAPPDATAGDEARLAAARLVRAHGSDTLAAFKLRRDVQYLFTADRSAFLGYRVESGVLLVAGDPVGPPHALPGLVRRALAFAEVHGLRIAVLGAGATLLPLWRDAGLRPLYIGDEAILETASFTLDGRRVRKVRQAVARVRKAGYTAELRRPAELDEGTLAELEAVSARWRAGAPERGFTMAMDRLTDVPGGLVVLARDASGAVRGFLHFVPAYGRAAVSLSAMRRERQTPNGLTEFLVVSAVELLRERGVAEVSLNFAAFGRLLQRTGGGAERALARLVVLAGRWFQIESLYRFNAKFSPRWEPRYLVFESVLGLPRAGLAALWAEGQLPRLPLGGRS